MRRVGGEVCCHVGVRAPEARQFRIKLHPPRCLKEPRFLSGGGAFHESKPNKSEPLKGILKQLYAVLRLHETETPSIQSLKRVIQTLRPAPYAHLPSMYSDAPLGVSSRCVDG